MLDWDNGNPVVEYDYTHPERHHKGLLPFKPLKNHRNCYNSGYYPGKIDGIYQRFVRGYSDESKQELCSSCGWTAYDQTTSSYLSRIRIMHARFNMGLWSIGSKWLIRDQPNDRSTGAEYMTWKFLHEQPGLTIPLPKQMQLLSDPEDPIQFTLISRAPGVHLSAIWHTLTPEQKQGYRDQMVDFLKQLRQFTAPRPQRINGDELEDNLVAICQRRHSPTCIKMGFTEDEWLENMTPDLRLGLSIVHDTTDPTVIEEKLQEIKDNFPRGGPYVLSHTDLNMTNIIVQDDKIQAIVDWEMAGYYPWWAEYYAVFLFDGCGQEEFYNDKDNPLWSRVHPDFVFDGPVFTKIRVALGLVVRAFGRTTLHAEHHPPKDAPVIGFWRPRFCKCQPFGGTIPGPAFGVFLEHKPKGLDAYRNERYDSKNVIKGTSDSTERSRFPFCF
ncbi:hypothetical protein AYO21_02938 [Fonsecaea monophora]|uniref:Aminoglycoside phosphotransferase domain-containing protein n=1 Tax=Fonsecaea monophora TaxID=254056 RepID=A0A177FFN6_9EURO|nr:hypothetical protein AYO21_02938 [Fonsecaea monophora]KAH0847630.1 Protein kinase-like (PK-like) [Fonsecaea pedrosoi]OAG42987.1 hypothetical protein AYO21_02938 [Fonsecaea monophora]